MIDHSEALAEPDRLGALASYDLDDPQLKVLLDALSARTAERLGVPIGLVTMVLDCAQLIAGAAGIEDSWMATAGGTPAEWSFCATAVVTGAPYVVEDAAQDPVQHDNPLVTIDGVGAYAGFPVFSPDGHVLGTTCVLDGEPRHFSASDLDVLRSASWEAAAILEDHRRGPRDPWSPSAEEATAG